MATVGALDCHRCRLNHALTGRCNNTGHYNQLAHQVALQISEHPWVFIWGDLELERRLLKLVTCHIVILVDPLNGFLQCRQTLGWLLPHHHSQWFIKCKQMLHRNSQEVFAFSSILFQLLTAHTHLSYEARCVNLLTDKWIRFALAAPEWSAWILVQHPPDSCQTSCLGFVVVGCLSLGRHRKSNPFRNSSLFPLFLGAFNLILNQQKFDPL